MANATKRYETTLKTTWKFYLGVLILALLDLLIANLWLGLTTYGWGLFQGGVIMGIALIASNTKATYA